MKTKETTARRNRMAELLNHVMEEEAKTPHVTMYLELVDMKRK